jgi:hypothetical protein
VFRNSHADPDAIFTACVSSGLAGEVIVPLPADLAVSSPGTVPSDFVGSFPVALRSDIVAGRPPMSWPTYRPMESPKWLIACLPSRQQTKNGAVARSWTAGADGRRSLSRPPEYCELCDVQLPASSEVFLRARRVCASATLALSKSVTTVKKPLLSCSVRFILFTPHYDKAGEADR